MIRLDFLAWMLVLALWLACDYNMPQAIGWLVIILWLFGRLGAGKFVLRFGQ